MTRFLIPLATLLIGTRLTLGADPAPDFAREVRPILSQFCFKCHGPDEKTRKAKLRLDQRDSAIEKAAIVPGKPNESEMIARLYSEDAEQRMPPESTKLTLTDAQKQILKRWVTSGAEYREHWAFMKLSRPQVPVPPNPAEQKWIRNPIDAFVYERLVREGMKPSLEAEKAVLARRVYLDLIGLPPSPAELETFLKDNSPNAYEKLVDQLLASPQYGERWARRWLDLARYADTNGYEKDRQRSVWPYRDWVIRALNADMPFSQFTIEQIAGDMLPNATVEQRVATGFHRNTMLNEEGGIDPLEFRYHAMNDRVSTTGTVWLGLTLQCSQCHSHKYDPIPQRDYYRLFAFLNNADEPEMQVPSADLVARKQELEKQIAALTEQLPKKFPKGVDQAKAYSEWLEAEKKKAISWRVLKPVEATSNSPLLTIQPDDSVFVSGDITKSDLYQLLFRGDMTGVTAVRIEALPDERLPRGGPGATYYEGPIGDFTLSEINALVEGKNAKFSQGSHSFASGNFNAQAAIDGNPQTGWSVNGGQGKRHIAVFTFEKPLEKSQELRLKMLFERHFAAGLGRFRVSVTTAAKPLALDMPEDIEQILVQHSGKVTDETLLRLKEYFYLTTPHLATERQAIDTLRKQIPSFPTALVMRERPPENPRATFIHHRGEYLQPNDKVEAGTLSFLPPLPPGEPKNRLGFARWLVSNENPLTPRVTVNRQWQAFFGRGLVRTTEDFGFQGEFPTHQELLDWLAAEFIQPTKPNSAAAWSQKGLHKLIVTSATYRQSSRVTAELKNKDPENKLYARGPRVRMEAEMIRDSVLKAAGLLSLKMGGPSVFPPQPASVTTEGTYGAMQWKASEGEDRYRRSIYTFAKRTAPFALYTTFDAPSGESCLARRDVSNTPLHALFLMNDNNFLEPARALGRTIAAQPGTDAERIQSLAKRFLVRSLTPEENKLLANHVEKQRDYFRLNKTDARAVAGEGMGDPVENATWTTITRVFINVDEFITKN